MLFLLEHSDGVVYPDIFNCRADGGVGVCIEQLHLQPIPLSSLSSCTDNQDSDTNSGLSITSRSNFAEPIVCTIL